ncbi:cytochrome P450 2U1-like [Folsomia candida]|uniref:cytochrome P450 2U1-like n=1 Tax=Folsomia candida TaxID=158441 RepID=UPI001604C908|nr:cytochrome P450 2U1-like [Folsomia candida]
MSYRTTMCAFSDAHRNFSPSISQIWYIHKPRHRYLLRKIDSIAFSLELFWVLVDLFVTGTDTTSQTLVWAVLLMTKYPDVKVKFCSEIDTIIGRDRFPLLSDKVEMSYCVSLIYGVMRYMSLVPFSVFHSTTKDTELGSYFIPMDTMILRNLWYAHHNQELWDAPEKFRPECFLVKGKFMENTNFLAFSYGKRVCPGRAFAMDELFLTSVYQEFDVTVYNPDFEPLVGMLLYPKSHNVIFKKRHFPR